VKLERAEIDGLKFWHRPGFSDLKTFEEVLGRKTYLKRGMKILPGEKWMDCGGNVGAFALLACQAGAEVGVYEPAPSSLGFKRQEKSHFIYRKQQQRLAK
jgi:hypothetical protein